MQKQLLLGDEAIAEAAMDAGISGIYAYPGTPSTEITEYIQSSAFARDSKIRADWSVNEKTAYEAALGMSFAGKRTMVCMKHVGVNVAADGFINSAITGVNGGFILIAADDPSMHSSQNEQDSRFYGKFAMVPVLEPSDQQEAYDMTRYGFELSEKFQTPVMLRITTRLAHSRAGVGKKEAQPQKQITYPKDPKQFVLLPAIARSRYKMLLGNQAKFIMESETSGFNQYISGSDKSIGIIATGIAFNYLKENFPNGCPYPVLKISQYPVPESMLKKLAGECKTIIVMEEGAPMIEELIRGVFETGIKVKGRLDGTLPRDGELNPNLVGIALGISQPQPTPIPSIVANRPPSLCKGCSHSDMYLALNEVMKGYTAGRVFSDIGCYTLGALPPYNSITSCVDMGASITMAKGAADAGLYPSVAVIGDSTFTHSGITGLLDAVNDNANITLIISDNSTTGMTGGQKSAGTGKLAKICEGVGVDLNHLRIMQPLHTHFEENVKMLQQELEYKGVSVIIAQRECIQTFARRAKEKKSVK